MSKKFLRIMQLFTVVYFTIMLFIGSVARIAWNYNDLMSCEWPQEIEKEAWSLELDEFLLVKDGWEYIDGEYVRRPEFSRWSDESVISEMVHNDAKGFEDLWRYDRNQAEHLLVVYSDMRVEYLDYKVEEDSCMVPYYLIRNIPAKIERLAGRLDYAGRSIPYHLLGKAGLWLVYHVPIWIGMATVVWTIWQHYSSRILLSWSASVYDDEKRRRRRGQCRK